MHQVVLEGRVVFSSRFYFLAKLVFLIIWKSNKDKEVLIDFDGIIED